MSLLAFDDNCGLMCGCFASVQISIFHKYSTEQIELVGQFFWVLTEAMNGFRLFSHLNFCYQILGSKNCQMGAKEAFTRKIIVGTIKQLDQISRIFLEKSQKNLYFLTLSGARVFVIFKNGLHRIYCRHVFCVIQFGSLNIFLVLKISNSKVTRSVDLSFETTHHLSCAKNRIDATSAKCVLWRWCPTRGPRK